jgi:hypothetical protein
LCRRLSVRHRYFNLPKQTHDLLWSMRLSSRHKWLLSYQFVSSNLVQKMPGIPTVSAQLKRLAGIVRDLHLDCFNTAAQGPERRIARAPVVNI